MKPYEFYRSLHERGEGLKTLADKLQTSHTHLSQVFNGKRGGHTRRKLARYLTARETQMLGWTETGQVPEQNEDVPRGTSSHVVTINNRKEETCTK